jgi:hypothetical protein
MQAVVFGSLDENGADPVDASDGLGVGATKEDEINFELVLAALSGDLDHVRVCVAAGA